jgi:hypothetical protein
MQSKPAHILPSQIGPADLRRIVDTMTDGEWSPDRPSLMIWGPPGVGKSSVVAQSAAERGYGFVDIRLTQVQVIDLLGLPYLEELASGDREAASRVTRFAQSAMLPPAGDEGRWIIMLDELPSALPAIQVQAYQMMTEHRIGPHRLPASCHVVAAGNRISDRAVVHRMPSALISRCTHVEVAPDLEQWLTYMYPRGLRADVAAYLRTNPQRLLDEAISDTTPFACPRTWTYANWILNSAEQAGESIEDSRTVRTVLEGTIGPGVAADWFTYRRLFARIPDTRAIMEGRDSPKPPEQPDVLYATVASLVGLCREYRDLSHFLRWLRKLPRNFAVLALRDSFRLGQEVRKRIEASGEWPQTAEHFKDAIFAAAAAKRG